MFKICCKCERKRRIDKFSYRNKENKILMSWCKDCVKTYDKKRYRDDIGGQRKRSKLKRQATKKRNRKNIWKYLKNNPCVDCGETDPVVLTFDHISNKEFNISCVVGSYSWDRILKEIHKCEVRCANCHMRKTAKDYNWYK
jgi:hypothetical protein